MFIVYTMFLFLSVLSVFLPFREVKMIQCTVLRLVSDSKLDLIGTFRRKKKKKQVIVEVALLYSR